MRLKWLVVVALICGIPAFAGTILLNNTGAGTAEGSIDPNWILQPGADYPAYVVTSGSGQFSTGWLANDGTSKWIAPRPTYTEGTFDGQGNWVFRTTFNIDAGMDPLTASITGNWLADNGGIDMYINGAFVVPTQSTTFDNFAAWSAFAVSSGFASGLNTLDFIVLNQDAGLGGPTGLRVEMAGTVDALQQVPEPATFGLLGAGLLALGLARRRRQRA